MKKNTYLVVLLSLFFACDSQDVEENNTKCQQGTIKEISETAYEILEIKIGVKKSDTKSDTLRIAAILLKPKMIEKRIFTWELTTFICKKNNLVAADFYQKCDGKPFGKSKYQWESNLVKNLCLTGTVDALHHGKDWKRKICKKDFEPIIKFKDQEPII